MNFRKYKIFFALIVGLIIMANGTAHLAQINDNQPATANKNYEEAMALFSQRTADSQKAAREKLRALVKVFAGLGDNLKQGITLLTIGLISENFGEKADALETYNQALTLFRTVGAKDWESTTLHNLGSLHSNLGAKQKALDYLNLALSIEKTTGDKMGETETLTGIGLVYASLGENQKALEYYNQALPLQKTLGDKNGEAVTSNNIGAVYDALGDKQAALSCYMQALPLEKATGDRRGEADTLTNIGMVLDNLGEKQKALDFYFLALPLRKAVGDKRGEAVTLNNIGSIYLYNGEQQKALDNYEQAFLLVKEIEDKTGQASTLNNIGTVYDYFGNKQKALEYYYQALPLRKAVGDKRGEAATLVNIGQSLADTGDQQKALQYFNLALPLEKQAGDKYKQAITFNNIMYAWEARKISRLAIFYGKQSINIYQEMRQNINTLNRETQNVYLKSIEPTYRRLADILIRDGRIAEAEQILSMLKEEEFLDYFERDDKVASELREKISLSADEQKAFADYEKYADEITRTAAEFGTLEKKMNELPLGESLTPEDRRQYDALKIKYDSSIVVFNKFLDELKIKFTDKGQQYAAAVALQSDTQGILKRVNEPHTAIISTIAGDDRLNLIVTTTDAQRAHTVDIKAADLNKLVSDFREAVKNPKVDPRPAGKKLYDVLFPADLQKDLDGIKADTIVWSLDGGLRYVPVAALWDGEHYLVELYSNAVLTLASRDKIGGQPSDRTKWQALGVGVSKPYENFPALSAVPQELCSVVRDSKKKEFCDSLGQRRNGVIGGMLLPDEDFTLANFENNLGRVPVIHIASHFSLNAGNEMDSFLLLGGGNERRFSLADLRRTRLDKVELLTLSACNTAMTSGSNSSGVEIEGFGAMAQNQGAKTVVASLWAVADDSTRDLMKSFYSILETDRKTGKAGALRLAQLGLLNGENTYGNVMRKRGTEIFDSNDKGNIGPLFKTDSKAPFSHPFYWSPFIMFGNWH